jgi:hypothetical protein
MSRDRAWFESARLSAILVFSLCAFFCLGASALAQNSQPPIPVPQLDPGELGKPGFRFAAGVPEVVKLIPHGPGARTGHLWIGNTGGSIRIVGEVDGPAPDWPKDARGILSKDHVEVWLAGPADVEMPPLSWQTRMATPVQSEDDCKDAQGAPYDHADPAQECRDWFETQQDYRPLFNTLFVRQWLLADEISVESFATPAYERITKDYGENVAALQPHGAVRFHAEARPGRPGYIFEIDIPFTAFPPLNAAQVSGLRLMVDVFSAAPAGKREGSFATTSIARVYGDPGTFNVLHLDPPIAFEMSPCHPSMSGVTVDWSSTYPAWFVPSKPLGEYQADAFLVEDWGWPAGAEDSQSPSVSPQVHPFHYFWRALGAKEWVCGPELEYRNANAILDLDLNITSYDAERDADVTEYGFDARSSSDSRVLIKVGPRVWNAGSQVQCGACPRTELRILSIDKNLNLITLLDLENTVGGPPDLYSQDFSISPDWSQITEFDQTGGDDDHPTWSSVTYCFGQESYSICGQKEGVKPPDPPLIRQFLGQE